MKTSAIFSLVILAGCQGVPPPEVRPALAEGAAIASEQNMASIGGWTVICQDDTFKNERTCRAGTFGASPAGPGIPFRVVFVNGSGPTILAGHHNFPGREPTIRVDAGPVISATRTNAAIAAMRAGTTAYVVYHVWPEGEKRTTVDVSGFDAAYQRLLTML